MHNHAGRLAKCRTVAATACTVDRYRMGHCGPQLRERLPAYPSARLGRLRSSLAEARGSAIWRAKGAAAPRPDVLFQGMRQALSQAARWDSRDRTRLLLSIWSKRTLDSARYSRQAGGLRPSANRSTYRCAPLGRGNA
jgi:hypothetical protein